MDEPLHRLCFSIDLYRQYLGRRRAADFVVQLSYRAQELVKAATKLSIALTCIHDRARAWRTLTRRKYVQFMARWVGRMDRATRSVLAH